MNINEVMSTDVKSCHPQSNLDEVARLMWDNDCGAIPVVDEKNKPLGIITDRDIAMAAMHNHRPLWEMRASQLVQEQHPCCSHQEDSLESCLSKMENNGVRRIMVTNRNGTLAGLVSMGDILAFTSSRKSSRSIGFGKVLDMLKKVSGHHASRLKPLAVR